MEIKKEDTTQQDSEKNFDKAFAMAWNEHQGNYSENLAKKVLKFIKLQGLNVNTVLDVCCGSANFLNEMKKNGKMCTGTEILDTYVAYNKSKYPNINFFRTNSIGDIENLGNFDLISCNHDVVNMFPTLDDWGKFFKNAYDHLNNGGLFIFDYYTKRKLKDWNETYFDSNDKIDYIKNVVCDGSAKTIISNIYYINLVTKQQDTSLDVYDRNYDINDHESKYKKAEDTVVEYYFDNKDILSKLKQAGYRYLITADGNLNPISMIDDVNRMHIIAIKHQ